MNTYAVIVLIFLLLDFTLGLTANLLNLRSARKPLPSTLENIYRAEDYRKSQAYLRATTLFGLLIGVFTLVVLLAFWFSGGFNYLDQMVVSWGLSTLLQGMIYLAILAAAFGLLSLPFSLYGTFVIEQRFGFNKTTPRTFITDLAKSLVLGLVIGGLLLAGILFLFEYAGNLAWLYIWIAVTLFSLFMQYVSPNWIMPLFNKFKPLEPGELRDSILQYSSSVKFPLKNVVVMDGSRRSSKSNAFFTGFGGNKRIALFDTLIAQHTVPELVAVLAHEVGHYKKKHILQGMIIGIINSGVLLFLLSLFMKSSGLYEAFYLEQQSIYTGLLFFGLLYTPLELVLSLFLQAVSRRNEYAADRYAAETIAKPQDMVAALKKLSSNNLSNLTPHPFYVFLNYSHPPLLARIQAIQKVKR